MPRSPRCWPPARACRSARSSPACSAACSTRRAPASATTSPSWPPASRTEPPPLGPQRRELRRALLDEARHALAEILGGQRRGHQRVGLAQRGVDVLVEGGVDLA